ncbi:MAG: 1-acyl-sn-glycerol-3-phosphate acyltransferase [Xanthomonadales bacterium]
MEETVTLANWQFFLLLVLAAYALLKLVILPLLQRLIYHRSQTAERLLNEELKFGLPSYALASRELWIDRIVSDPQVIDAIEKAAGPLPTNEAALAKARKYATEIVPNFNALLYFRFFYWLARKCLRLFYWIQVGSSAQSEYEEIAKDSCIVMVSNHRSNFDPLLLIYLTSKTAPISYSAGEWARVTPFRQFLHAIGFYIIRRDQADNPLYHKILERYVFLATSHCIPQGVFIEGGLSRDGRFQPLKLGLLNYMVKAAGEDSCKDIVFIPCALNYDKIPEDKTLIAHQEEGFEAKGRFYSLFSFLKFIATVTTYMMPRRHKPFGYACVNFGSPISLNAWQQEHDVVINLQDKAGRRESITALGKELATRVSDLLPILPTCLLARVLSESNDLPISELDLKVRATKFIEDLINNGAPVFLPNNDGDYALSQGIYVLLRRKIIEPTGDGRFKLVESRRKLLEYYCNTISGFMDSIADDGGKECP